MVQFLTSDELEEMTGYKNHAAQAAWLADNNYRFDLRKDGRPNVLVDQLRERQCVKSDDSKPGLDLSWIDQTG